jgi:hypothetical protein
MLPELIGVIGKARAGKDTFAQHFISRGYMRLAFADELKREVSEWLGITPQELEKNKEKFRTVLQYRGAAMRIRDKDYWLNLVKRRRSNAYIGSRFIISDVRYTNEADWIKSEGGVLVRVIRLNSPPPIGGDTAHASETELDNYVPHHSISCLNVTAIEIAALRLYAKWCRHDNPEK